MKIELLLTTKEGKETRCTSNVDELTATKRISLYVLKLFAILVGTAVCGVIPLLHFIVIPAGLIFFGYVAVTGLKMGPKIDDTQGTCPNCNATFLFFKKPTTSLPYTEECDRCHHQITVSAPNYSKQPASV